MTSLGRSLRDALKRRESMLSDARCDAIRLFNGRGDGVDGLVIERLGSVLIVQIHEGRLTADLPELRGELENMKGELRVASIYLKEFIRDRTHVDEGTSGALRNPAPWIGEVAPSSFLVHEPAASLIVRPYDGFSVGVFLEHRENRRRIRELARGLRVLNAFAYTCGFSVAAALGGAASVSSVDLSVRYLEWGKENFAANGLPLEGHWFFRSDIFDFFRRAKRQNRRYDLIVLDPPTFSKTRRPERIFQLRSCLDELVAGALELLDPGGIILLATNDRQLTLRALEASLHHASAGKACTILDRPGLPPDFPGDPEYSKTVIARFR